MDQLLRNSKHGVTLRWALLTHLGRDLTAVPTVMAFWRVLRENSLRAFSES